jgi:mRNA-degrading endonuclease RelE of RelBE toxin-antitoxin system
MQAEYNLEFTKLFVKQFEKLDRANQKRVYKKNLGIEERSIQTQGTYRTFQRLS